MELKELREQAAKVWVRNVPAETAEEDFIAGAEWEFERDKWIEGENPPDSGQYLVLFLDHSIEVRTYRLVTGWATKYPIVKWAFIP